MTARPLQKVDVGARQAERIRQLENVCYQQKMTIARERNLRKQAETNAARFHALMLQARVALITKKDNA